MLKNRKYSIVSLLAILILSLTAGIICVIPPKAYSTMVATENKTLPGTLKKAEQLFSFEDDSELDNVEIVSNVSKVGLLSKILNAPRKSSEGLKCLQAYRALVPCTDSMAIKLKFGKKDFTDTPIISFAVNSYGGMPGTNLYYVKAVAISSSNEEYSKTYGYVSNTWNAVSFDISDCAFLNDVRALKLVFFTNSTSSVSWEGGFQIDNVFAGRMIDFRFIKDGNTQGFTANGATLKVENDMMTATATSSTIKLDSPILNYTSVLSYLYTSAAEIKNAIYTVVENKSSATEMQIRYKTNSGDGYTDENSKSIKIDKNSKKMYVINFSDKASWNGNVCGFEYVFNGVKAGETISIDSIVFHEDEAIYTYAENGVVGGIVASDDLKTVNISGSFSSKYKTNFPNAKVAVYANACSADIATTLNNVVPLATIPVSSLTVTGGVCNFNFNGVTFIKNGNKTYFDNYFTVAIIDSSFGVAVAEPRAIDNIEDFVDKKYYFKNPTATVKVRDMGAKGDGFTDDTDAIQLAIDTLAEMGGGRVLLDDNRTYIATNVHLKDNITFEIQEGSILRQSEDFRDYKYNYELGHNSTNYSYINWAHCNVVSNYPILQANGVKNIKVTGKGKIIMSDADNYGDDLINSGDALEYQYSVCSHRLHSMPVGFYDCENVEISNIRVAKSSGYHLTVTFCRRMTIYGVEMQRVKCVSSDGISVGACDGVLVCGIFLNGNDDGIVLSAVYEDPRELWNFHKKGECQASRNIEVYHSYIASGGGKAISLITWGTSDPDPENEEMYNITVIDCSLSGGFAVGVWPDNPYNGKYPFDNSELNDWSNVKDLTVLDCEYLSPVNVYPVIMTGLITDFGLTGAEDFQNAEFEEGKLYWTLKGNATVKEINGDKVGCIEGNGSINEGLYLKSGEYLFKANIKAEGENAKFFVKNAFTDEEIISKKLSDSEWSYQYLYCVIDESGTYRIGIESAEGTTAYIDSVSMTKTVNESGDDVSVNSEVYTMFDEMPQDLTANSTTWLIAKEGENNVLTQNNCFTLNKISTRYDRYTDVKATLKLKLLSFAGSDNMATIQMRASDADAYVVYFSKARNQIAIRKDKKGETLLATTVCDMELNTWYDIAVSCENTGKSVKITLSVDGKEILTGEDFSSFIQQGCFAIGCYNTSISVDDLYVTETVRDGFIKDIQVKDANGYAVNGATVVAYSKGVTLGEYTSADGKISVSLNNENDDIYYTALCFGYESITDPKKLGADNTITLNAAEGVLTDNYSNSLYWGFGNTFNVSDNKLVQTDGLNNAHKATLKISGFEDFTSETNIIYKGGNAGPGNNISLIVYKGADIIRLEYQPYYGLVALHDFNRSDGNDFYSSAQDDSLKNVGTELRVVYGTTGATFFIKVYSGERKVLDSGYGYTCNDNSTTLAFSTYGICFESNYFMLNASERVATYVTDENYKVVKNKQISLYDGSVLLETTTTNENGFALFDTAYKNNLKIVVAGDSLYDFGETYIDAKVKCIKLKYNQSIFGDKEQGKYTIVFVNAENNVISTQKVASYGAILQPNTSGISGFVKWNYDFSEINKDTVVSPIIADISYTLTFKDEKGNVLSAEKVIGDKAVTNIPGVSVAANKYLAGWKDESGELVDVQAIRTDKVLTAVIKDVKHRITFIDKKGDKYVTYVEHGKNIVVPTIPDVTGYIVSGYNILFEKAYNDMVILLAYRPTKVKVSYADENGNILYTAEIDYNSNAPVYEMPKKDGYEFIGYDVTLSGIKRDTTVKAVYTVSSYDVIFFDFDGNVIKRSEVKKGESATAPKLKSNATYIFKGWSQDFTNVNGYLEVYPIIRDADKVDVIFVNTLTGETFTRELDVTNNTVEDLSCEGYTFEGWYYDAGYGKKCDFKNDTLSGKVYVYSKWSENKKEDKPEPPKKKGCGNVELLTVIASIQAVCITAYFAKKK